MILRFASLFTLLLISISANAQKIALVNENNLYGYIDSNGEYIIEPQFKKAKDFSENGLAPVRKNKKWGYINTKGDWVIQPQFDNAKVFINDLAWVANGKKEYFIDVLGKMIIEPKPNTKYYDFNKEGVAIFKTKKLVGLINSNGEIITEPKYQVIKPFINGYAKIKLNNLWGIIDSNGKEYISPIYSEIGNYINKVVQAREGNTFKIITNNKSIIIENASKIWDFRDGSDLTMARVDKKVGYINTKGEWAIEPQFKVARHFVNGIAPVYDGRRWGYINTVGEYLIEPQYNDAEIFGKDIELAPVKPFGTSNWGFINKKGQMVIPATLLITPSFSLNRKTKGFIGSVAKVKQNNKWGFITPEGNLLGEKQFSNINIFVEIKKE
ncbi:WG repeat-containing protein [Tamlana sp. 2201CG12-4]|uniref:WG repeat-containing protein n=1 Tax=Tamlana sp. 2201CG12-4 TaxID=3112582 RepID=UPI002DBC1B2B|nr:WG repeat-containing protein [Tamlana sp. 2201CG12-4]MEC3906090.1 WG repeat-containing protein [Tamlana sp. 2201CG12-4]